VGQLVAQAVAIGVEVGRVDELAHRGGLFGER
jgi:hypothetical protein